MPIGPSLPPHLAHLTGNSPTSPEPHTEGPARPPPAPVEDEDDDDDDDYGPALPPHLAASRKTPAGPAGPSLPAAGPSLPSSTTAAGPSRPPAAYEEDSDDDDVIGPMPVPTNGEEDSAGSAVREFLEREERRRKILEEESRPKEKKREEWMLVPPSSGVLSNVDPLRKRPSTFSKSTREPESVDHSVWTETPAEKAQRIADEVAGIKRKKAKAGERIMSFDEEQEERRKRRREEDIRNTLQAHNRGPSLLDQHASKLSKKKKGEDDEAPAIWDHDRDMGVTGRLLTDNERQKKIKDARGLGDRFGHGKAGAYSM